MPVEKDEGRKAASAHKTFDGRVSASLFSFGNLYIYLKKKIIVSFFFKPLFSTPTLKHNAWVTLNCS